MTIAFQLEGPHFLALNGGPHFTFSPAISLVANCKTQREIDNLWGKLARVTGSTSAAGSRTSSAWSRQIVPADIGKMLQDSRDGKADRVMQAILSMKKIDVAAPKRAAR